MLRRGCAGFLVMRAALFQGPVAFVLSGGATLGAAQVGMLRGLQEQGVVADLYVGTSVGALNAAVCAADPSGCVGRLDRTWRSLRRGQVFPVSPRRLAYTLLGGRQASLVSSAGLAALAREHLGELDFAALATPLVVVTTDLRDGSAVAIDRGQVSAAVVASASIPGVFPPVVIDGRSLVDGGLVANLATEVAVAAGARTVVVLEASGPCRLTQPPHGVVETLLAALFTLTRSQAEAQARTAAQAALVVHLPTPCTVRNSPLDFSGSGLLADSAYDLTGAFLVGLPKTLPETGWVGEPHRHTWEAAGALSRVAAPGQVE